MNVKCKALALDLDGTLTNSDKKITRKTHMAVQSAMEKGIQIFLASGRPVLGISPLARALGLFGRGGYILAYNGGHIIDCKTEETIYERTLPMDCYGDICKLARDEKLSSLTYDDEGVVSENDNDPYVIKEAFNNGIPLKKVERLDKAVKNPVVKFMIVGEPDKISVFLPKAQEYFKGRASVYPSEPYFLEVAYPGIEKASALSFLIKHLGIEKSQLVACGDGLNDITMLRFAGYAVAMENASDEVKRYADYVTLSNNDDGVAEFLKIAGII